jgi:pyruvate,orthophosphate dikinase
MIELRGGAAIVEAVGQVNAGTINRAEAVNRVQPGDVEAVLHDQLDSADLELLATGTGASPGGSTGAICLSSDEVLDHFEEGMDVILVASETSPADEIGMRHAAGILTCKGGQASHAAVVARGWGIPAVCGASSLAIDVAGGGISVGDRWIPAGETISINGATGEVFVGGLASTSAPVDELQELLGWADEIRAGADRALSVRANADTAEDARRAREFGAEGIGLCRTEHQFLGDRLPLMRELIFEYGAREGEQTRRELYDLQVEDFTGVLAAMDGLPVVVRLLDPPLHEFLPDLVDLEVSEAKGELDEEGHEMLLAARTWHEKNPMIGTRGVRLGVLRPSLYRTQAQALLDAVAGRVAAGGDPRVSIMIPLVVSGAEIELIGSWIQEEIDQARSRHGFERDVKVGIMIETPRAALVAGELTTYSDFFSFGTNDLTQLTYGFSRDDVEVNVLTPYLEQGLLDANPFAHIDTDGVGALVKMAVAQARAVRPGIEIGVCGEHGGDPESIRFFAEAGCDYVSCSPFRVPVARLVAAQIASGSG